jgi:hypothetical protein
MYKKSNNNCKEVVSSEIFPCRCRYVSVFEASVVATRDEIGAFVTVPHAARHIGNNESGRNNAYQNSTENTYKRQKAQNYYKDKTKTKNLKIKLPAISAGLRSSCCSDRFLISFLFS